MLMQAGLFLIWSIILLICIFFVFRYLSDLASKIRTMKLRSLVLLFVLTMPGFSYAQQQRENYYEERYADHEASVLSVFSENGEQFFLVLNGVSQNNMPTSRIRVEGLPKYGNDIEIIFADQRTQALRKSVNIADPVDGKAVDMVLKISRGREGYPRLRFHKCTEIEREHHAERDEYVMYYGRPGQRNTVTTTTTSYQTTPPPQGPVAMDQRTFSDAKHSISRSSFDDTKLSTAKTILSSNYVTTDQVIEICKLFSFEDNKLTFAEYAYSRTVDPNNYFKVGSIFNFDASKESLNSFISSNHR